MSPLLIYLYFNLVVLAGAVLQGCIGFGNMIICMNFVPLFLPYSKAVGLLQVLSLVLNLFLAIKGWHLINWKVLIPETVTAAILNLICTYYSLQMSTSSMMVALGIFFVFLAIYFTVFASRINIRPTVRNGIIDGIVAGSINGLFGTGGPPAVLFYSSAIKDKESYIATIQMSFAIIGSFSVITRLLSGVFAFSDLGLLATGGISSVAGALLGSLLLGKVNDQLMKKCINLFIAVNGIIIVLSHI